jgi:hypothetical protein
MKNKRPVVDDDIRREVYFLLFYVKLVLIALAVYLFVLTVSDGVFILQNIGDHAVGTIERRDIWAFQKKGTNAAGVGVRNFGFKKQTNIMKSFVLNANVTGGLLPLEYR